MCPVRGSFCTDSTVDGLARATAVVDEVSDLRSAGAGGVVAVGSVDCLYVDVWGHDRDRNARVSEEYW